MSGPVSPWVRVVCIVDQRNAHDPVRSFATVHHITGDTLAARRTMIGLYEQATAAGHRLPNLAATQTVGLVPLPADVIDLIRRLTDPDPCWYDHQGDCRAHNTGRTEFIDGHCPHRVALDLLTAWDADRRGTDDADQQPEPAS